MSILFGVFGDGKTLRAFSGMAAAASLGSFAVGAEAERLAEGDPFFLAALVRNSPPDDLPKSVTNSVDYAATGSVDSSKEHEFVVLAPCGAPPR
jgi:hypothetical protein